MTVRQVVNAVTVTPPLDSLVEADTLRLSAEAADANGHAVAGAEFDWVSSDTLVAVVDGTGLVTGVAAGDAEVTATTSGVEGSAALAVVTPLPTTVEMTPDTLAFTAIGETAQISAEVRDQIGRVMDGAEVAWSTSDDGVATVAASGLVTAVDNGSAMVTATAGEASASATAIVRQVVSAVDIDIDSATVLLGDTLRLSAAAADANGHAVAGAEIEWSSSAPEIAPVDEAGLMRGVTRGTTIVTARSGTQGDSATVNVVPAVTVTFSEDSVRVAEGETAAIGISYRVRRLASPLSVRAVVEEDDAEAADYELSETRFEIPAGSELAGTLHFTLVALADNAFAEGEEGLSLLLAVPEGGEIEIGNPLPVRIADAPVSACVGVSLAASPPEHGVGGGRKLRTSLTMEWGREAMNAHFEWVGPYPTREEWTPGLEHHPYFKRGIVRPNQPGFHLSDWRIDSDADIVRHTMSIEWSAKDTLAMRFRAPSGACDGEPMASCGPDGCTLDRQPGSAGNDGLDDAPPIPRTGGDPSVDVAGYHLAACDWGVPANTDNAQGWSVAAWPPGDTLDWFVSRANWPANAAQSPEELGAWIRTSTLDRIAEIPTADIKWRMAGVREADEAPKPVRDGVNTVHLISPEVHGGTYIYGDWNSRTGCFDVTESDIAIGSQYATMTDTRLAQLSLAHDFGHALRLEHAGTFPLQRSSADPWGTTWDQWRAVSGVWPLDPSMSYGASAMPADEAGSFLRLDDRIAFSLARPRSGWLAEAGSISGRIHVEGNPMPYVHVWALMEEADGRIDGIGAFANEDGEFRIQGLPPGEYHLWAHPDLEWLANPWLFGERQGELFDVLLPFPVRVRGGRTTGGIEIMMSRGRSATGVPESGIGSGIDWRHGLGPALWHPRRPRP